VHECAPCRRLSLLTSGRIGLSERWQVETTALTPEQGAAERLLTRDRFPTTARGEYVKEFKPMKERSSLPVVLIGLLAAVLHTPGLLIPLWGDGLHGVYMAALSFRDPSRLLSPWMGGAFRLLPKLVMMGVLAAGGVRGWPFYLVVILLHGVCAVYVARLGEKWSASRLVGLWAGALFAVGFGSYGKAVYSSTNVTMLLSLTLLLVSLDMFWSGRRTSALVFFILAVASHEVAVVAPALIPFMILLRDREHGVPETALPRRRGWTQNASRILGAALIVLVLLGFLPGALGQFCRTEVGMSGFMLVPVNRGSAAAAGAGPAWMDLVDALARSRFWIGAAVALFIMSSLRRRCPLRALSAAWIYLFLVPSVVLMLLWGGDWWERRYLYVPAVGACLLASSLILRVHQRSRARAFALLTLLVIWSLSLGILTWHKVLADSLDPQQVYQREEYFAKMGQLNPRWGPPAD